MEKFETEKGTILFVEVPDDSLNFASYMGYLTYRLPNPKLIGITEEEMIDTQKLDAYLERTKNIPEYIDGTPIKLDDEYRLMGTLGNVPEDKSREMFNSKLSTLVSLNTGKVSDGDIIFIQGNDVFNSAKEALQSVAYDLNVSKSSVVLFKSKQNP